MHQLNITVIMINIIKDVDYKSSFINDNNIAHQ